MPAHRPALATDLDTLLRTAADRRRMLRWLMAGAATPLAACGGGAEISIGGVGSSTGSSDNSSTVSSCSIIPIQWHPFRISTIKEPISLWSIVSKRKCGPRRVHIPFETELQ